MQLSFSACERYLLSPFSYFAHYFLRLRPTENSSALFFGSAVDEALNVLLAPPLNRSPETLQLAYEAFKEAWATAEINGKTVRLGEPGAIKFSKSDYDQSILNLDDEIDIKAGLDPSWVSLRRKGFLILEAYAEQIVPRIKEVMAVQKEISLANEVGDTFTGIIDLIVVWEDGKTYLMDNKTSSIKYAKDAVEVSGQLSTYYEAVKDEFKLDGVGYIVIPKQIRKKKLPLVPIEVMIGIISDKLIDDQFNKYEQVLDGVKNGRFSCTRSQRDGCCSKPWGCSYRRYCESGGKDMTGLVVHKDRK